MSSGLERDYYPSEEEALEPSVETPTSSAKSHHWLPFGLIAPITVAADIGVITLASLISGVAYHWLTFDKPGNISQFLALGVLVAANFSAITMARQNYRPINLIHIGRQARYATLNWLFIVGLLTVVAFSLKVETDFSRGATLSFFILGLAGLVGLSHPSGRQSQTSIGQRRLC